MEKTKHLLIYHTSYFCLDSAWSMVQSVLAT